jgi:MoxR-like ATPase
MPALLYRFQDQEYRFPLKDRTTIGCGRNNDLCLPSNSISLLHAVITRDGDGYQLEDTGSDSGIVINGQRVLSCPLRDGAVFSLGEVEFAFELDGAEPPPTEAPTEAPAEAQAEPPPPAESPAPAEEATAAPVAESALRAEEPPTPAPADQSDHSDKSNQSYQSHPSHSSHTSHPSPDATAAEEAPAPAQAPLPPDEVIARFGQAREQVLGEIGKVIIGQREVLNQMLVALFARGHCLLIGVPGLAKTLMVRTLGSAVDLESRRIQFTPDLMPSDITGTDILEEDSATGKRAFRFHRGPIFSNLLLADEINRTPPKTQAALLEAMQEQRVTISGTSYDLPNPFMVLATQNPIEQEGTYPLPEAQLDRFMFCIHLAYPSAQEEQQVILDTTREAPAAVHCVLDTTQVLELQQLVRRVPVSQHLALYALSLVRATRPNSEGSLDFVNRWVNWGAGPRAGQYLLLAAKTHVLLQGRFSVSCADVREYALPVLRHRIFPTFTAASESVTTDQIVKKIVAAVKEPQY